MARVWIDVGAHYGETMTPEPGVVVYGFEPNISVAFKVMGQGRMIVVPFAVSEIDGPVDFNITANDSCSSILPLDGEGALGWRAHNPDGLRVVNTVWVPSVRLDTFLRLASIEHVEYLKIDAQGADLAVVRSAGDRLACIDRVRLEVQIARSPYAGAATKAEVVEYMTAHGFELVRAIPQSQGQEENLDFERVR